MPAHKRNRYWSVLICRRMVSSPLRDGLKRNTLCFFS